MVLAFHSSCLQHGQITVVTSLETAKPLHLLTDGNTKCVYGQNGQNQVTVPVPDTQAAIFLRQTPE